MKYIAIFLVSFLLSGCSFVVELLVFNNTGTRIEICNVSNSEAPCVIIPSQELNAVEMINNMKADSWAYRINEKIYRFNLGTYPEQASKVYCKGFIWKRCAIPLQLEPSGLLYWAGKNHNMPVNNFVTQPKGFPVEPDA